MANLVRHGLIFMFISVIIPFSQAFISYPECSIFYGRPFDSFCNRLLWQTRSVITGTEVGLGYTDTARHWFVPAGMVRPLNDPYTSDANWRGRVELNIYRGNGATSIQSHVDVAVANSLCFWAKPEGCKLAVIPRRQPDGTLAGDRTTYRGLANEAQRVADLCVRPSPPYRRGGWKTLHTESNLIVVLYQPGSQYDNYVTAEVAAGREVFADAEGIPMGDPTAANPLATTNLAGANNQPAGGASGSNPPGTQQQSSGPICGQYCASVNLCTGSDSCKCIADPWQGIGSGYFTGTCKLRYSASGRKLGEIYTNSTSFANSTGAFQSASSSPPPAQNPTLADQACPCNCTYVSKACCSSASGIVYEAPNLRMGAVRPPNATAFCDLKTGEIRTGG